MATVNGITAEKAQEIEDASVVSGTIDVNGHLILQTAGGTTIDAGLVIDSSGVVAHAASSNTHGVSGAIVGTNNTQSLSNKTLVTPTISSFINAQHDHTSTVNGGAVAVDAVLASFDTVLTARNFISGASNNPLSLAQTVSLAPGKYIILASCSGYTPSDNSQQTRMEFWLSASAGSLYTSRSRQSVDQATMQGGLSLTGYLENGSSSVVTFYAQKLNTGTSADTSTEGFLVAIRVSDMS